MGTAGRLQILVVGTALSACTAAGTAVAPVVEGVEPEAGYVGESVSVTIAGRNFYPRFTTNLEGHEVAVDNSFAATLSKGSYSIALEEVSVVDEHLLTAVVPAGIDAGWYALVVTGPRGTSPELTDAYEALACPGGCVGPDSNQPPKVANPMADLTWPEQTDSSFIIPADTFSDPDPGDSLAHSVTTAGSTHLPSWLTFDPVSRELSGRPAQKDVGVYSLEITATDDGDPNLSASDGFELEVTAAPKISIVSPPAGAEVQAAITIAGTCEPNLTITVGGDLLTPTTASCAADGGYQINITLSPPDGNRDVTVAQTSAGGTGSATLTVDLDTSPPTFTLAADSANWTNSLLESPAITWEARDRDGNVATVEYAIGTGTAGVALNDEVPWTPVPGPAFNVTGLTLSEGGPYFFNLRATDMAGNVGSASSDGWTVDVTRPTAVSVVNDGQTELRSSSVTPVITWPADTVDPVSGGVASGVSHFEVAVGTGISGAAARDAMAWTDLGSATSLWGRDLILSDGTNYHANLRVLDVAGNVSPITSSDGWLVLALTVPTTGGVWVLVPAYPDVDQLEDFYLAKFEMKAERDDTDAALCCVGAACAEQGYASCAACESDGCGPTLGADKDHGCGWDTGTCPNEDVSGRLPTCCHRPESRASGTPWVKLSRDEAASECASLGPGFGLVTNQQWMATARNLETVAANWLEGDVYGTTLNRGHTAGTAGTYVSTPALVAGNDDDPWFGTGLTCDPPNTVCWHGRRVHTLSNGEILWDLGGNVYEMMADFHAISFSGPVWQTYNTTDPANPFTVGGTWPDPETNRRWFAPANDDPNIWYGDLGGRFFPHDQSSSGAVISRGGRWDGGSYGGIFCAFCGSVQPTFSGMYDFGFRCAYSEP